jgi:hypothetical protein
MLFSISGCTLLRNVVDDPDKEAQEEDEDDDESDDTKKTKKTEKTTEETTEETSEVTTEASTIATGEPNLEIQALMVTAAEEFDKVESYHGTTTILLDTDLTIDATGAQNVMADVSMDYDFYAPTNYVYAAYQIKMKQGTMEVEMPMEFYIIEDNGTKMYMFSEDVWTDQSAMAADYYDIVGHEAQSAMFEVISAGSYGLEMTDTEQLDGQAVYTITGELTGEALKMLFETSSAVSSSGTAVDVTKLNFDNYHVPIVMQIYKETNLLATCSYDMIEMLEDIMKLSFATSSSGDIAVVSKAYQASVSFSDYDTLDNPTIPAEVLEAVS